MGGQDQAAVLTLCWACSLHRFASQSQMVAGFPSAALLHPALRHLPVCRRCLEHVVEVMRDAAGELAHRLHLLAVPNRTADNVVLSR